MGTFPKVSPYFKKKFIKHSALQKFTIPYVYLNGQNK